MGRVVHFEITAEDVERAKKFYEIFDWKIENSGMEDYDYWLAKTGNEKDMGVDGAIMSKKYRDQPSIIWIDVDDIKAMLEKVKAAGGSPIGDIQTVPGIGDTVYVKDTEGNTIGLIQPLPRTGN